MYFQSRSEAGKLLADKIEPTYQHKDCVVIALSDGGVVVAAQIASRLHCVLSMLLTAPITLPREDDAIAVLDQDGGFAYNDLFSVGELEELTGEYQNYIEQEKLEKLHGLHRLLGKGGLIKRELLLRQNIILVSDGLNSGFSLDAAVNFLKPVEIKRLIIATPLASIPVVDRMHVLADEFFCLSAVENYISTDHYYEQDDVPEHDSIVKSVRQIVLHWK